MSQEDKVIEVEIKGCDFGASFKASEAGIGKAFSNNKITGLIGMMAGTCITASGVAAEVVLTKLAVEAAKKIVTTAAVIAAEAAGATALATVLPAALVAIDIGTTAYGAYTFYSKE